jgi:hypothetical protein
VLNPSLLILFPCSLLHHNHHHHHNTNNNKYRYAAWQEEHLNLCARDLQEALDIRRELLATVPFEEQMYSNAQMKAAAAAASAAAASAAADATGVTDANADDFDANATVKPFRELAAVYKREFGESHIELAVLLTRLAMLRGT